ncbi:MAG TPA: hypothetical protein VKV05_09190 [Terriglobales bacterium]|nr:hypothetical protein [Terriglobales bacterium]
MFAETEECEGQNEESDCQQPDHFATVARAPARFEFSFAILRAK